MIQSSILSRDKRFVSSPKCPDRLWTSPASYSMGTGLLYSGVKRLELYLYSICMSLQHKKGHLFDF
jgi:hypothetical protein